MSMPTSFRFPRRARAISLAIVCIAFVAAQFVRPELRNPSVTADLQDPSRVKQILTNSCYNCHSNQTKLSWFDRPVPAYWLVVRDVTEARKHLNFSVIDDLNPDQQRAILYEAVSQISLGAMPPPSYKRLHPGSVVTLEQLAILKKYLQPAAADQPAMPPEISAADAQYNKWLQVGGSTPHVALAPNGIALIPDYKNWRAISSTERWDNHTLRQVLGNDLAIKAIAENRINPWPDGAAFAKVAWLEQPDDKGATRSGAFFQVEFMVRDSKKYASTLGWGWARWRGADLKPYGKDPNFAAECVGCHSPLRGTNYVFTLPMARDFAAALPMNPLGWKVITSEVNSNESTMATLYGNEQALSFARTNPQHDYPPGAAISMVTWTERDDPRWFGAKTPDRVKSVEFVTVGKGTDGKLSYSYQIYSGTPLKMLTTQESLVPVERAAYVLAQRAAVMP